MSRKIGLGDVHFDHDIDGEIDFDFFGDSCVDGVENRVSRQTPDDYDDDGEAKTKTNDHSLEMSHFGSTSASYAPHQLRKSQPIDINTEKRGFRSLVKGIERTESESDVALPISLPSLGDNNHSENDGSDTFDMSHRDGLLSFSCRSSHSQEENDDVERIIGAQNGISSNFASSKDLLRVAASERCSVGSPTSLSSDSSSDSASDLYSLTDDSLEDYDQDSGSEITDVSPLSSANMSPLPESPKKTTEPKNNLNNFSPKFGLKGTRNLKCRTQLNKLHLQEKTETVTVSKNDDTVDLKLLTKAILELEEERKKNSTPTSSSSSLSLSLDNGGRVTYNRTRKNMTFTNDEVKRIEQENKRLLQRIIDSQKPRKATTTRPNAIGKVASSAVNRIRELKKIEVENLAMLKRLHAAKPTKELSREYLLGAASPRNGGLSASSSKGHCSSASSRTCNSFHSSNVGRDSAGGRSGRSLSTGSISSPSGSYSTSSSAFSSRSRSLKLPGGFLSHGQEARSGR